MPCYAELCYVIETLAYAYSTIQRDFRTRSALPLHCLFPWEVYSCKPHIALLEQLEANA